MWENIEEGEGEMRQVDVPSEKETHDAMSELA